VRRGRCRPKSRSRSIEQEVATVGLDLTKSYVNRGKADTADAEAICEAVTRPTMRFVAVKSVEQQSVLMLHKSGDLMVRRLGGITKFVSNQSAGRGHSALMDGRLGPPLPASRSTLFVSTSFKAGAWKRKSNSSSSAKRSAI
jgi:hypothetical protein